MNSSTPFEESEDFRAALHHSARHLQQNQPEEAEKLLAPLHGKAPKHIDVAINLSGAYILQRKWNKAVRVLQAVADAHPNNAMLWMNLGAAQLGRLELSGPKQQAEAIRSFERAIEVDPFTPHAHYQIGLIYKDQGAFEQAATYFEKALQVQPADRDAKYWLEKMKSQLSKPAQHGSEDTESH